MGQNAFGVGAGLSEQVGQNATANNRGCIQKLAPNSQELNVSLTQKMGQSGLAISSTFLEFITHQSQCRFNPLFEFIHR